MYFCAFKTESYVVIKTFLKEKNSSKLTDNFFRLLHPITVIESDPQRTFCFITNGQKLPLCQLLNVTYTYNIKLTFIPPKNGWIVSLYWITVLVHYIEEFSNCSKPPSVTTRHCLLMCFYCFTQKHNTPSLPLGTHYHSAAILNFRKNCLLDFSFSMLSES